MSVNVRGTALKHFQLKEEIHVHYADLNIKFWGTVCENAKEIFFRKGLLPEPKSQDSHGLNEKHRYPSL